MGRIELKVRLNYRSQHMLMRRLYSFPSPRYMTNLIFFSCFLLSQLLLITHIPFYIAHIYVCVRIMWLKYAFSNLEYFTILENPTHFHCVSNLNVISAPYSSISYHAYILYTDEALASFPFQTFAPI